MDHRKNILNGSGRVESRHHDFTLINLSNYQKVRDADTIKEETYILELYFWRLLSHLQIFIFNQISFPLPDRDMNT